LATSLEQFLTLKDDRDIALAGVSNKSLCLASREIHHKCRSTLNLDRARFSLSDESEQESRLSGAKINLGELGKDGCAVRADQLKDWKASLKGVHSSASKRS